MFKIDMMYVVPDAGNLVAFFDVDFNGIVIRGFRMLNGKKGFFISGPKEQGKDGKYYDHVVFKRPEDFQAVFDLALEEYNKRKETGRA